MAFDIILDQQPKELLEQVSVEFAEAIEAALHALAANPAALSRVPPCPPFPPVGLLYEQKLRFKGRIYFLQVFFAFGPGQNAIGIVHINVLPAPPKK